MADLVIASIEPADSGEVLTLQRAAYVTEAQLYDDWSFPALIQSHQELRVELAQSFALKAVRDGRIIGAVRARRDEAVWRIWRLTVAPDAQGLGIGTRLLAEVERRAPAGVERFALFTGHLSVENIRLYERLGYRESRREMLKSGIELVHLEKAAEEGAAPECQ